MGQEGSKPKGPEEGKAVGKEKGPGPKGGSGLAQANLVVGEKPVPVPSSLSFPVLFKSGDIAVLQKRYTALRQGRNAITLGDFMMQPEFYGRPIIRRVAGAVMELSGRGDAEQFEEVTVTISKVTRKKAWLNGIQFKDQTPKHTDPTVVQAIDLNAPGAAACDNLKALAPGDTLHAWWTDPKEKVYPSLDLKLALPYPFAQEGMFKAIGKKGHPLTLQFQRPVRSAPKRRDPKRSRPSMARIRPSHSFAAPSTQKTGSMDKAFLEESFVYTAQFVDGPLGLKPGPVPGGGTGIVVADIMAKSQADLAVSITPGDLLLSVGKTDMRAKKPADLAKVIKGQKRPVNFTFMRQTRDDYSIQFGKGQIGIRFGEPEGSAPFPCFVAGVKPGSQASKSGMVNIADVVVHVGTTDARTLANAKLAEVLRKAKRPLRIFFRRPSKAGNDTSKASKTASPMDFVRSIWNEYDLDQDGALNSEEAAALFQDFTGRDIAKDICENILRNIDADGDAKIQPKELSMFIANGIKMSADKRKVFAARSPTHETIIEFFEEIDLRINAALLEESHKQGEERADNQLPPAAVAHLYTNESDYQEDDEMFSVSGTYTSAAIRDSISFLDFVNIFQVLDPRYDSGVREMVAWKLVDVDGDGLLGYDDLCYFLTTLLHGQGVGSAEIRYKADVVMDDYGLGEDGFIGRGTFFSLFKDSLMRVISIPPAP
jgi:Ca2+-binding EF-hand superfamily protein